jgi:GTP cyclohydrolase I
MNEVIVTVSHACMLGRMIRAIGVTTAGEDVTGETRQQENQDASRKLQDRI